MSLTIRLSQVSKTNYAPGDWIGGVVRYTAAKTDEDLECIGISFSGTTTAQVTRNNTDMVTSSSVHKVSKGCLFRQYVNLEHTKKLHGSGTFAWPFLFRIPPTAVYKEGYNNDSEAAATSTGSPWKGEDDAEAHPLPPSFCYKNAFSCSVQYQLCAKLTRLPSSILQGQCNLTTSCEVRILPRLHVPRHDLESFGHRTQKYFCNFEISHRTKLQALAMKARQLGHFSSTQPCCQSGSIQLRITVPKVIIACSQAPIIPSVELTCSGCEHLAQVETVRVKSFTFDLVSLTEVRAGVHTATQVQNLNLCRSTFTLPVFASDDLRDRPDDVPGCGGTLEGDGRAAREAFRRSRAVPEFATYNIFRAYTTKFKISIDFKGKTLSFQQQNIPVQVVDYADDMGTLNGQSSPPPVYTVTTDVFSAGGTGLQSEDIILEDLSESCPGYTA